jgi:hypothetical protein
MCDLCSSNPEVVKKERENIENHAKALRLLADDLEAVARGQTDPHGMNAQRISAAARRMIIYLVNEWM